MAQALRYRSGGIVGLASLIDAYSEAIESDLIDRGLRLRQLGTDTLSWRDLKSVIAWAPAQSAIGRAIDPDSALWGLNEHLLADVADSLHWLVWAKTEDARKQPPRNRPQQIPRPGVDNDRDRIGTPMSPEDMDAFLGW
ncbi:DUF5361 domain-containing protein [Nocardia sp. NPDC059239]|uniref:DUF5361 domain-containing protein n=1 Tax=unclassified Nocardia TaxID=2637762 RepID=UPI0036910F1E